MSGATASTIAAVVGATAAAAGAGVSFINGQAQAKQQKKAASQAEENANKLYSQQEQANNRMNARKPNVDALFAQNQIEGQQGASGTMLTGPQGVDPSSLTLNKNTLLGGA